MTKEQPLQDAFLNDLRRKATPVFIYLISGIKLKGTIHSFDQFVIFLKNNVVQMIYKHSIATIIPVQSMTSWNSDEQPSDQE